MRRHTSLSCLVTHGTLVAALTLVASQMPFAPLVSAAETLRVGKAVPQAFSFVPLDVGVETGIFRRSDIEIESSGFGGAGKLHQALAAGSLDIGLGSGAELALVAKGAPVLGVAAMAGRPLLLTLVVRADGPIKSVSDLKGRTISVTATGSLTDWLVRELSRQQGWGPNGIRAAPLGAPSGQVAALKTKHTDGMVTDLSIAYRLEESGDGRILLFFGDYVKVFHIHVIYATHKIMQEKPDAVRRFLKGWFETIAFMRKNKTETVAIAKKIMSVPDEVAGKFYDRLMPMFSDDGKFDPAALKVLQKSYVELGTLDQEPDMTKLYTEKFLPREK